MVNLSGIDADENRETCADIDVLRSRIDSHEGKLSWMKFLMVSMTLAGVALALFPLYREEICGIFPWLAALDGNAACAAATADSPWCALRPGEPHVGGFHPRVPGKGQGCHPQRRIPDRPIPPPDSHRQEELTPLRPAAVNMASLHARQAGRSEIMVTQPQMQVTRQMPYSTNFAQKNFLYGGKFSTDENFM